MHVYNTGKTSKTEIAVRNFLFEKEYDISYMKCNVEDHVLEHVLSDFEKCSDYIWLIKDCILPNLFKIADYVNTHSADCYAFNAFYEDVDSARSYELSGISEELIAKNLSKFITIGSVIVDSQIWSRLYEKFRNTKLGYFTYSKALIDSLVERNAEVLVIHEWCLWDNSGIAYECISCDRKADVVTAWSKDVLAFEKTIALGKYNIDVQEMKCYPFNNLWNVVYMRYRGNLNYARLTQNKEYLIEEKNKKLKAIILLTSLPRNVSKAIILHSDNKVVRGIVSLFRFISLR